MNFDYSLLTFNRSLCNILNYHKMCFNRMNQLKRIKDCSFLTPTSTCDLMIVHVLFCGMLAL